MNVSKEVRLHDLIRLAVAYAQAEAIHCTNADFFDNPKHERESREAAARNRRAKQQALTEIGSVLAS